MIRRFGLSPAIALVLTLISVAALPILAGAQTPAPITTPGPAGVMMPPAVATPSGPIVPLAPDVNAGRELYTQVCASCHGATGDGKGPNAAGLQYPPTAFNDSTALAEKSPLDLFGVARAGRMDRMMPPWGARYSDQQLWNVVGYLWSLRSTSAEVGQGAIIYAANCVSCHGTDGKKSGSADLASPLVAGKASAAQWEKIVASGTSRMPAFTGKLDQSQQRAALAYVRTLVQVTLPANASPSGMSAPGSASAVSATPATVTPLPGGSGVITGSVVNGTTGLPVPNLAVTLRAFQASSHAEQRDAITDRSGNFRFDALPTDPAYSYAVTTEYPAGQSYGTDIASFTAPTNTLAMPFKVYETTTDAKGVKADRVHFIVDIDNGRLLVAEMMVFSLDGNRTYVGDGTNVLSFTVPAGAQELAVSDGDFGERYVKTENGFIDTQPLLPGSATRQIVYSYALPITGKEMDLVRTLGYPAAAVNGLIADQGEQVSSPQMSAQGSRQMQQGNYLTLLGQNLAANQQIALHLSNLPLNGSPAKGTESNQIALYAVLALIGVAVGAIGAWLLLRGRNTAVPAHYVPDAAQLQDELAALEQAHADGKLSDVAYRDRRLKLKAQLHDLIARD
jgi:mono/diheme cytochrome c family protein